MMIPLEDDDFDECTEMFTGQLQLPGTPDESPEVFVGLEDTASVSIKDSDRKLKFEETT